MSSARLLRHEWALQRRSGVARVLIGALTIIAVLAIAAGATRVGRAADDARLLAAAASEPLTGRGADYLAFQRGTFAILPPAPLLALTVGQFDVHPQHHRVTARLYTQPSGEQLDHPAVLHAGRIDLAFVILYVYSLLIVGLSYDLVATERQNGTLRLLLVQGASMTRLASSKVAARALLAIAIPVLTATVAFLVAAPSLSDLPRLVLWIVTAIVYGGFWLAVAVHVNARGRSAAANALTLAGLWLLLVLVAPSLVNLATRSVFPLPSRVQLDVAMREASRHAVAEGSRMLGRFLEDHPATGTGVEGMRQYYALQHARDERIRDTIEPLRDRFEAQRRRQARVLDWLRFVSPTILTQTLLVDLAGTSGHRAQRFAAQAAAYQDHWRAHFTPDALAAGGLVQRPRPFVYDEEPLTDVVGRVGLPLVVFVMAVATLGWIGMRRFAHAGLMEVS